MITTLLLASLTITTGCDTTPNSAGPGAILEGTVDVNTLHLHVSGAIPDTFGTFIYGAPIANPVPFYDGRLCSAWWSLRRTPIAITTLGGEAWFDGELDSMGTSVVQYFYRDTIAEYGGNLSNGLVVSE